MILAFLVYFPTLLEFEYREIFFPPHRKTTRPSELMYGDGQSGSCWMVQCRSTQSRPWTFHQELVGKAKLRLSPGPLKQETGVKLCSLCFNKQVILHAHSSLRTRGDGGDEDCSKQEHMYTKQLPLKSKPQLPHRNVSPGWPNLPIIQGGLKIHIFMGNDFIPSIGCFQSRIDQTTYLQVEASRHNQSMT